MSKPSCSGLGFRTGLAPVPAVLLPHGGEIGIEDDALVAGERQEAASACTPERYIEKPL